jgi:hypothetical protein
MKILKGFSYQPKDQIWTSISLKNINYILICASAAYAIFLNEAGSSAG